MFQTAECVTTTLARTEAPVWLGLAPTPVSADLALWGLSVNWVSGCLFRYVKLENDLLKACVERIVIDCDLKRSFRSYLMCFKSD